MKNRLARLRKRLDEKNLDAAIVSKNENVRYLSGFCGDSATLVVAKKTAALVTDSRYTEQAEKEAAGFLIVEQKDGLIKKTAELTGEISARKIGFEGGTVVFDDYTRLKNATKNAELVALKLDDLRLQKDESETANIKRACAIADAAFLDIVSFIRPGVTEKKVAAHLENFMRENGSERPAFTTIVASGERGSLPHGTATEKKIAAGELVTMDFGAVWNGYCSDITRTVCVGRANEKQREIYDAVLAAQMLGVKTVRPGISGIFADAAARKLLAEKNLAEYFGHGLGHGVGLEIHEEPRLSPKSKCEKLEKNMTVTVEPGVYIKNFGGVRIEDTMLVTDGGCERLTESTRELIEI